jgi:hypothetical protein
MSRARSIVSALALLLTAVTAPVSAEEFSWPKPLLPRDAALESPGESMTVNGMPLKIYRYETASKPDVLTRAFRSTIEGELVRGPVRANDPRATLAGRSGGFWLTLQLGSAASGRTIATWSAAPRFIEGAQREITLPPGFPNEAELYQHVDSFDDDRRSQMAIGMMRAPVDAVAANLAQRLRELGFAKQPFPARNWSGDGAFAAVYSRSREEIVVSLRPEAGGTALVVNRISALDRLP